MEILFGYAFKKGRRFSEAGCKTKVAKLNAKKLSVANSLMHVDPVTHTWAYTQTYRAD